MDILPELSGLGIYEKLWEVLDTGEPYHVKNSKVDLVIEGILTTHYFNYDFIPLKDEQGRVYGVMNTAVDVTDLNVMRQQHYEAESRLKLAVEASDFGTYETNLITQEVVTSKRFNIIWGLNPPVTREAIEQQLLPEDRAIRHDAHIRALETDGKVEYEARVKQGHDGIKWLRVKGMIQRDSNGEPKTLLGITQDITSERELSESLRSLVTEKTSELQRSNEDLLHFAHIVSHDLKEPIRKIQIFNGMAKEAMYKAEYDKSLFYNDKISHSSKRMVQLVDGILNYSEINAKHNTVEEVNLSYAIENSLHDLEVLINEKNADITRNLNVSVQGFPVLLEQLFYNLINNALKFSREGEPPRIVLSYTMELVKGTDYAVVSISDNGIGIPVDCLEKIFKPFTRLHSKDKYQGSGLGLALCRRIVERHNGSIVALEKAIGSEFIIRLPQYQEIALV